ncbi:MAG: glycosyl transferase family 1, partial [Chloroflexus aggregans]
QATVALCAHANRDLIVTDDTDAFAHAILELLTDPERCAALGRAGRKYVEQYHNWNTSVAQIEIGYLKALSATRDRSL